MRLMIKNMVSESCKKLVQTELSKFGLNCTQIEMGEVVIEEKLDLSQQLELNKILKLSGLEIVYDRKTILVEKIKAIVAEMIFENNEPTYFKFSVYLSKKLNYDYHYLSGIFVAHQGMSLEHYIISQRIESVKELLSEDKLSLSDISIRLYYSSAAHLSNQFKKIVGCTPGVYRQLARAKKAEAKFNL